MSNDDWPKNPLYSIDPFPKIAPSLLNSADIIRYANKGCLVDFFDKGLLNPATYTIRLLGTLYWWETQDNGLRRRQQEISKNTPVTIRANSISYLFTEERFRLPQYIAARFNLHIRYVHKGILLGTGPLIDPGFAGSLLIPLHNLTDNHYEVKGGDNLLWVEFTKLTAHDYWTRSSANLLEPQPADLVPFPPDKLGLDEERYLAKAGVSAMPGVQSAFKGALEKTRELAKNSEASAAVARERVTTLMSFGVAGTIAVLVGVVALVFVAWQLWQANADLASRIHDRLDRIERATGALPSAIVIPPRQDTENAANGRHRPASGEHNTSERARDDNSSTKAK